MNQEISKPASLACFPAEQFKKIEMACTEVNKNLIQLLHDWTNLDKKMRQDWDSKLQRCQELFAEIENEMALIRKGKKDGRHRFVEMIDAIAESLEIIGFDQALMEVSKVILEDYQEDGELIPDGARLRFRVSDKPEKSGAATRISLKVNEA